MTARARTATHAGVALLALMAAACGEDAPAAAPPPQEVYVTSVVTRDVPVYLELVGQTLGSQDTEIRARVEGVLESLNFREGTFVQRGQLLYEIDRKPLEATLAQAKADQATAEARPIPLPPPVTTTRAPVRSRRRLRSAAPARQRRI